MQQWKSLLINSLELGFRILLRIFARPTGLIARAYRLAVLRLACKGIIPVSTQFDGPVYMSGTGRLTLGEYCRIGRGVLFETSGGGEIVVGNRVRINDGSVIAAHSKIVIGDDTLIGEYVSVRDANHGMQVGELMRRQVLKSSPVSIGKDVWIGRGACVLMGCTLGDGAVIGANSVIVRSVDEGSVVAGNPAEFIRKRSES